MKKEANVRNKATTQAGRHSTLIQQPGANLPIPLRSGSPFPHPHLHPPSILPCIRSPAQRAPFLESILVSGPVVTDEETRVMTPFRTSDVQSHTVSTQKSQKKKYFSFFLDCSRGLQAVGYDVSASCPPHHRLLVACRD